MSDLTNRNYIRESPAIVNSKYSLSKQESDIVTVLLTGIHKEDEDFKDYKFTKSDLEKRTGTQIKPSELKATAKSLMSKVLEVPVDENDWELFTWFSYFKYQNGEITCSFDKRLKPYLLELGQFVLGDSRHLLQIKGSYSRRIYMMLKERHNFGERIFDVDELMDILQVPKSYRNYADFKRKVLEKAKSDINRHTDLAVSFKEKKIGKKVTKIIFTIKKNHDEFNIFKEHIKENYVNVTLAVTSEGSLACSEKGLLYYKEEPDRHITKEHAMKIWEGLFANRATLLIFQKSLLDMLDKNTAQDVQDEIYQHHAPTYDSIIEEDIYAEYKAIGDRLYNSHNQRKKVRDDEYITLYFPHYDGVEVWGKDEEDIRKRDEIPSNMRLYDTWEKASNKYGKMAHRAHELAIRLNR